MSEIKGIDISVFQSNVDFNKVKADGIKFVILRAGYGRLASQKDKMFESYYAAAKKAGLDVGAYWYSYATTAEDAKAEAEACYQCIKGKSFEYPIFFDYEDPCQRTTSIAKAVIPAFLNTLESKGYFAGLYSFKNLFDTIIPDDLEKRYSVWLAHFNSTTSYKGHAMWQHSSTGKVSGISGNVDLDICYVDYPALIKASGKSNGGAYNTTKPVTESTTKPATNSTPSKPAKNNQNTQKVANVKKGDKVTLSNTKLYASASSTNAAGTKTGTYYVYSGEKNNGRYAITNTPGNVGKTPAGNYVTGWVDASAID